MKTPIRVLIAEDNPADAEVILYELQAAGFEPEWERVDSESDYLDRLDSRLDIILSDYEMPQFNGLRALELLQERALEIPFIIISGNIGEDLAVSAMKEGATDYLLKDRLARLGLAVNQAMEQSRLRRERKQAVGALRLFRTLVDQSNDAFEIVDPETARFLDVNEKACLELGYTRAEYLTLRVFDIDPQVEESSWPRVLEGIRTAGFLSREGFHQRKDGSTFPIEINAKWVRLERDYLVVVVRNITERKRIEERMREQAAMLDRAHDAIIVHEIHSRRITFWNQGAERLYGWSAAEADGRDAAKLIFVDPSVSDSVITALLRSGEWRGEYRQLTKAGKELTVSVHATLVRDSQGEPKSALVINIDMTAQKNLEARLVRAQRMESIGTLASGVAHDLNNILTPILMSVPVLRLDLTAEQREEIVSTIELSAGRGVQIVKQVLTFGRGVEGEKYPLQVNSVIREVVKIIRETFPKNIEIQSVLDPDLWPVLGDATQIHQVLLNLCVNARDAMPEGGEMRLRSNNLDVDPSYASMLPEALPGPHVVVEVSDTGSGITPEVVERIFDPFFTTKGLGKGSGLGLSTVLGIVKSHGGFIQVSTEVGKGTTFQVYLPASPDQETPADTARTDIPMGHGEFVLVVDDEASVRDAARIALETAGYRVLLASDGTDALAVFATNADNVAITLTDLMMPFMDGVALTRVLRVLKPDLPIIASSGLGEKVQLADLKAMNVQAILHKPYGAGTLLRAIDEALHPKAKTQAS
jgi:PAS domain S-box-containing protein